MCRCCVCRSRMFVYLMVHDDGFAPCHDNGLTTLVCCKKQIRLSAKPGDILVGLMSKELGQQCGRKQYSMVWCGTVDSKITLEEYYLKYSGRRDCIYTDSLQHIDNSYHPAGDLENIRKDKQGRYALFFKDVHRFGNAEIDGSVLLNGKTLTQGHVVHDILPELHDIVQSSGGNQLFGSVDEQRIQRVRQQQPIIQAAAAVLIAGNLPGADAAGCEDSCPIFLVITVMAVLSTLCVLWYRCSCVCYYRKRAKVQDLAVLDDVVVHDDDFVGEFSLVHRLRGGNSSSDEDAEIDITPASEDEHLLDSSDDEYCLSPRNDVAQLEANRQQMAESEAVRQMVDSEAVQRPSSGQNSDCQPTVKHCTLCFEYWETGGSRYTDDFHNSAVDMPDTTTGAQLMYAVKSLNKSSQCNLSCLEKSFIDENEFEFEFAKSDSDHARPIRWVDLQVNDKIIHPDTQLVQFVTNYEHALTVRVNFSWDDDDVVQAPQSEAADLQEAEQQRRVQMREAEQQQLAQWREAEQQRIARLREAEKAGKPPLIDEPNYFKFNTAIRVDYKGSRSHGEAQWEITAPLSKLSIGQATMFGHDRLLYQKILDHERIHCVRHCLDRLNLKWDHLPDDLGKVDEQVQKIAERKFLREVYKQAQIKISDHNVCMERLFKQQRRIKIRSAKEFCEYLEEESWAGDTDRDAYMRNANEEAKAFEKITKQELKKDMQLFKEQVDLQRKHIDRLRRDIERRLLEKARQLKGAVPEEQVTTACRRISAELDVYGQHCGFGRYFSRGYRDIIRTAVLSSLQDLSNDHDLSQEILPRLLLGRFQGYKCELAGTLFYKSTRCAGTESSIETGWSCSKLQHEILQRYDVLLPGQFFELVKARKSADSSLTIQQIADRVFREHYSRPAKQPKLPTFPDVLEAYTDWFQDVYHNIFVLECVGCATDESVFDRYYKFHDVCGVYDNQGHRLKKKDFQTTYNPDRCTCPVLRETFTAAEKTRSQENYFFWLLLHNSSSETILESVERFHVQGFGNAYRLKDWRHGSKDILETLTIGRLHLPCSKGQYVAMKRSKQNMAGISDEAFVEFLKQHGDIQTIAETAPTQPVNVPPMFGKYGGCQCEQCNTTIPGDQKDYKRKCRDLFLFQQLGLNCEDFPQNLVSTRDRSLRVDKTQQASVLKGWKSYATATQEAVINPIMERLAGDRNLPKTWSVWKQQRQDAGALCHRCWHEFCNVPQ
jgi:hypothetical protein